MNGYEEFLQKKLEERRAENALRQLNYTSAGADFSSNDYLGFARNTELRHLIDQQWAQSAGLPNGAGGARLISGNFPEVTDLEKDLATYFKSEAALLFSSGYAANLGLISALCQRGDCIIYDSLVHASVRDGIRLSPAKSFKFDHNDIHDLERLLNAHSDSRIWIIAESVYSMDGDKAPLEELCRLSEKYHAALLLDEAHATGVLGKGGEGLAVETELQGRIFARVVTFGKALGLHGAAILGSESLKNYLVNFSRPFIYTTGSSPHQVLSIHTALNFLSENKSLVRTLKERVAFFKELVVKMKLQEKFYVSETPIQGFICPGNAEVKKLAAFLQTLGFNVKPIISPTVPAGSERLRICLHIFNTDEECTSLLEALANYKP